MENSNQVPPSPDLNQQSTLTGIIPPIPPKHRILKIVGTIVGVVVVVFILLAWYGSRLENDKAANKNPEETNNVQNQKDKNQVGSYSESELENMLLPKGDSTEEVSKQGVAIKYVFKNPEKVSPFIYSELSMALIKQGNYAQGAFWFYIFQSRTGAWVAKDPDPSGSAALKASLNEVLGGPINEWIGSDVTAFHDLASRAISYEKKFPFYNGKIENISEAEWQQALIDARAKYEQGFTSEFTEILADNGKSFSDQRKARGLYVGPWKNPGEPLLEEWK